jgi:hypothetical protein
MTSTSLIDFQHIAHNSRCDRTVCDSLVGHLQAGMEEGEPYRLTAIPSCAVALWARWNCF